MSGYEAQILFAGDPLEQWDRFVDDSPQGCIFSRSWWLQAVAPDSFEILVLRKGNRIVAGMPIVVSNTLGYKRIHMPPLTQTLGPCLRPYPGKYVNQLSEEKSLMTALIEHLPRFDLFQQNCKYSITNWLPFYWKGFRQTTRYTYVIEGLDDLDQVWANFDAKTRNIICRAEKSGIVVAESDDIETFLDLTEMTFKRQGLALPYSRELVRRLNGACIEKRARKLYITYDKCRKPHTGLFCVYDKNATYYLMQGGDPDLRNSGANDLATWKSIQFASKASRVYDFEGSMIESVERFIRGFGAIQTPYFSISKDNRSLPLKGAFALRAQIRRALSSVGWRK